MINSRVRYIGEWKYGLKDGHGTYFYSKDNDFQGAKYIGLWLNDVPHGHGTTAYPDGEKKHCLWKKGKMINCDSDGTKKAT